MKTIPEYRLPNGYVLRLDTKRPRPFGAVYDSADVWQRNFSGRSITMILTVALTFARSAVPSSRTVAL